MFSDALQRLFCCSAGTLYYLTNLLCILWHFVERARSFRPKCSRLSYNFQFFESEKLYLLWWPYLSLIAQPSFLADCVFCIIARSYLSFHRSEKRSDFGEQIFCASQVWALFFVFDVYRVVKEPIVVMTKEIVKWNIIVVQWILVSRIRRNGDELSFHCSFWQMRCKSRGSLDGFENTSEWTEAG